MSSTESKLIWVAVVMSLLLVLALGAIATYSVLGLGGLGGGQDGSASSSDDGGTGGDGGDGGGTATPVVGQVEPPVAVACGRVGSIDPAYAVTIANDRGVTIDYLVAVELTVAGATPLVATADVPALAPGERRTVVVDGAATGEQEITGCSIAAIQSDRRVVLATS